jgi:hypothetical protein
MSFRKEFAHYVLTGNRMKLLCFIFCLEFWAQNLYVTSIATGNLRSTTAQIHSFQDLKIFVAASPEKCMCKGNCYLCTQKIPFSSIF